MLFLEGWLQRTKVEDIIFFGCADLFDSTLRNSYSSEVCFMELKVFEFVDNVQKTSHDLRVYRLRRLWLPTLALSFLTHIFMLSTHSC